MKFICSECGDDLSIEHSDDEKTVVGICLCANTQIKVLDAEVRWLKQRLSDVIYG